MATIEQGGEEAVSSGHPSVHLPKLRWTQIVAISIFGLALNFHWAALGLIIVPSQVFKLAGQANEGVALAFVLIPGAFVSLFANPFFGLLSDRTGGWLAGLGRRRPYILVGTLVNIGGLVWMATAPNISTLAIGYVLVQFSNNAATAPFHALLPDIVPTEQRGLTSGVLGLLALSGTIGGVIVGGLYVNSNRPLIAYQQGLYVAYGIIIVVMIVLMLITILVVRERRGASAQIAAQETARAAAQAAEHPEHPEQPVLRDRPAWLSRTVVKDIMVTVIAVLVVWGLMALWNRLNIGVQINSDVQQVVLEIIATIGILRLFDFKPRRDPDYAWVLFTRLVMMLGIYTVQDFLQYYMRDAVRVSNPEQQTTNFIIILSLTAIVSSLVVGWLSDRFGRKRMVYVSGFFMALVGFIFIVSHSLPIVLAAAAIFGIGYGAYTSVDWALVADVLPSHQHYARDMGVWNIAISLPQVIAPVVGGPLIDAFNHSGHTILGYQLLFAIAIAYCLAGTVTVRFIRGVR